CAREGYYGSFAYW
nr:immunoglobulin heavy chain junction region [Mus musculus]